MWDRKKRVSQLSHSPRIQPSSPLHKEIPFLTWEARECLSLTIWANRAFYPRHPAQIYFSLVTLLSLHDSYVEILVLHAMVVGGGSTGGG